eukprot:CAMPEP_0194354502 /NCGR_PEP_ID=MMETSP0174-20130528/2655_1 /TAXON_ID=216777 /ORGANISM="Proboscia alata, Strain PI-D3" /LENGTH=276 /DNA_ID=CAMNT_0039123479 /DNA_START=79 /DNA_END=909 /DNA_ORIENTATION=+
MARPEEKAQNMMNKWVKMCEDGQKPDPSSTKRPYLASLCEHLSDAEKWRRTILREISEGVHRIQNSGMGEHAIRDLNDHINKLIREKYHWNRRIVELGGKDYNVLERRQAILERGDIQLAASDGAGLGLKGSGGYRYFGAAKDLPGVKELFARHASKITKRKRGDIYKYIGPDYYGLRDEEDGVLLELEALTSSKAREYLKEFREGYEKKRQHKIVTDYDWEDDEYDYVSEEEDEGIGGVTGERDAITAHVAVPTQDIVSKTILMQKKKELLERLS